MLITSLTLAEETKTIGTMAVQYHIRSTWSDDYWYRLCSRSWFCTAIFKFKQHKDNPTQVPVGTPVAMLAISAALVFLPGFTIL